MKIEFEDDVEYENIGNIENMDVEFENIENIKDMDDVEEYQKREY